MRIPINAATDDDYIYAPFADGQRGPVGSSEPDAFNAEGDGVAYENLEDHDSAYEGDGAYQGADDAVYAEPQTAADAFEADDVPMENDVEGESEADIDEIEMVERAEYDALAARYDTLMRDWDNYRRRSAEELEVAKDRANLNLIEAIIPTIDNFTMALSHATATEASSPLLDGFAAIYRSLLGSLEREGMEMISPVQGEPFDLNEHQAIERTSNPDLPPESIDRVIQVGYKHKGKVIRPALVAVSI